MSSKIVLSLKGNTPDEILGYFSQNRIPKDIDLIEIRFDSFDPQYYTKEILQEFLDISLYPLIFTCRNFDQGGFLPITAEQQQNIYRLALQLHFPYIDLDIRSSASLIQELLLSRSKNVNKVENTIKLENKNKNKIRFKNKNKNKIKNKNKNITQNINREILLSQIKNQMGNPIGNQMRNPLKNNTNDLIESKIRNALGNQIIFSYHNYKDTNESDIRTYYKQISDLNPDVIKIVTYVRSMDQLKLIDKLQTEYLQNDIPLSLFGMGSLGIQSRLWGCQMGNFFTYVSLDNGLETAPGQLTQSFFKLCNAHLASSKISTDSFGRSVKISLFGTSHSDEIGIIIHGIPPNTMIDYSNIQAELNRRRPGQNSISSARSEPDIFKIQSGVKDGVSTGKEIIITIPNVDVQSSDYDTFKDIPRPSQVDYPAKLRYGPNIDIRGSGKFSGRLTAPIVAAGAIAKQILKRKNIFIAAYTSQIGSIKDEKLHTVAEIQAQVELSPVRAVDNIMNLRMLELIKSVQKQQDSIGGVVSVRVEGYPAGIGDPWFHSLESDLAAGIFSIPGIRGVKFGSGFKAAEMKGSEHNDPFILQNKTISTLTNNCGGIIGGISIGTPILFKVAVKPTASIGKSQQTLNFKTKKMTELRIKGRHDPCIVPRIVVVIEAMTAIILLDQWITRFSN